jgi:TPR repeat protein
MCRGAAVAERKGASGSTGECTMRESSLSIVAVSLHLAMAVCTLCWPAAARADFADGLSAFDGGDYATAFAEWQPLADAGNAEAQSALAGLYMNGLGVRQDLGEAAKWYERAARQGDAVAQLNLGDLYAKGRGVRRDLVEAHLWLGLAANQGREWATRRRDEIAGAMTAEQLGAAQEKLRLWQPDPSPADQ